MWNNMRVRKVIVAVALLLVVRPTRSAAQQSGQTPRLLLTAQRLRRLRRDRERETVRWVNFEKRVQSVSESPERGFELALYAVVAKDHQRAREAVAWALAHPCETRQVQLVLDWAADVVTDQDRQALQDGCQGPKAVNEFERQRDLVMMAAQEGNDLHAAIDRAWASLRPVLGSPRVLDPRSTYPLCEILIIAQTLDKRDLRQTEPGLFRELPKEFLLSLNPAEVEHPDWRAHTAAFGLVALDPNLESAQFLQGWAMEDRQTVREGPGVAYEFLWADPYLPGIAYQNMDPWVYDPSGRLFARTDWNTDACWIAIENNHTQQQNCPQLAPIAQRPRAADKKAERPALEKTQFGTLTAFALPGSCADMPARGNKESVLLWRLKPGQQITFEHDGERSTAVADASGLLPVASDVAGKICLTRGDRH